MDSHLERGLRLRTDPEHKELYGWAINETNAQGQHIGYDQIPWSYTFNFTATSCVLCDSVHTRPQLHLKEIHPTWPEIVEGQVIRVLLRPEDYHRETKFSMFGVGRHKTKFSMFGTDRDIHSFELNIHPLADPAEQESCKAWGSLSYTPEDEFGGKTDKPTDDRITFYLFVKPGTFARYAAKIANGFVDEITLNVGSVPGFYSEWSPSIYARTT